MNWNARKNHPFGTILVTLTARQRTSVNLPLSYYVQGVAWSPLCDIRAKDVASPVQLFYKAQVTKCYGEQWENVRLTLSTGNPESGWYKTTTELCTSIFFSPTMGARNKS